MATDSHKGILGIKYNSLNLPQELAIKNINAVGKTYYLYSAGGQKLQTVHKSTTNMAYTPVVGSTSGDTNFNVTTTTDYVGNKVYENGTLKRVLVDGGYIEGGVYHYYLNDHLGNNRMIVNQNGVKTQWNHYYPFGMAFAEGTVAEQGKQPYKYNGKELDQMHGLNLYDYSARYYEPAIGRFTTVDPLAEKYYSISPYAYCNNNPINAVDLRGDTITTMIDGNKYTWGSVDGTYGFVGADGALYSGNNAFAGKLTSALRNLSSGARGKALVGYLAGSAGNVQIRDVKRDNAGAALEGNFASSDGKTIAWNPDNWASAPNTAGSKTRDSFIGLGHEMAHTEDVWKGTVDMTEWVNIEGKSVPQADKYATHVENQIRAEHGMPLRTHYAMYMDGVGIPSTQVLHSVGRERFSVYFNQYKTVNIRNTLFGPVVKPILRNIPYQY